VRPCNWPIVCAVCQTNSNNLENKLVKASHAWNEKVEHMNLFSSHFFRLNAFTGQCFSFSDATGGIGG
jgi:hypothetical protein